MITVSDWTYELRHGGRKQTKGFLEVLTPEGKEQCCLGVYCDLAANDLDLTRSIKMDKMDTNQYIVVYEGRDCELPYVAGKVLNIDSSGSFTLPLTSEQRVDARNDGKLISSSLAELNDDGFTFSQIADVIDYFFGNQNV